MESKCQKEGIGKVCVLSLRPMKTESDLTPPCLQDKLREGQEKSKMYSKDYFCFQTQNQLNVT